MLMVAPAACSWGLHEHALGGFMTMPMADIHEHAHGSFMSMLMADS